MSKAQRRPPLRRLAIFGSALSAVDAGKGKLYVLKLNEERTFRNAWCSFRQGEPKVKSKQRKLDAATKALGFAINAAEELELDSNTMRLKGFQTAINSAAGDIPALNELKLNFL